MQNMDVLPFKKNTHTSDKIIVSQCSLMDNTDF